MLGDMNNFEDSVFDQLERMRRQTDELFAGWSGSPAIRSVASGAFPAINVGASPDRVDVYVFVPGIDPKSLDLSLQQNQLAISGERTIERPEHVEFYRRERFGGAFRRVVGLPDDVDPDQVDATYRDGVLHIIVQRHETVKPRQIEVK